MMVSPPWADGKKVGVFASRSPVRPNPIGLSVVRIKNIVENRIYTSGLDAFDGTPLLDIKPYIKDLDSKSDANYGWIEEMDDMEHLILHIKGIPHDY
jgi:tRNA-Thr(GGU) m(6)t(6)A37 methyltransferase TsaA